MSPMFWWILLLIVGVIAGPFLTVWAVARLRTRRGARPPAARKDDDEDRDSGF